MNTFGRIFRITIFGESHGPAIGVIIDGVPVGIKLSEADFLSDLARRKPSAKGTTSRVEDDIPELLSGVFNGFTTGAPIGVMFRNKNVKSEDYEEFAKHPRPGHADFVALKKFGGYNDNRGGGHFSGRLTLALVAAGVIAKKIVEPIKIKASVLEVGGIKDFEKVVEEAVLLNDSVGGIVECTANGVPVGLGEPFFDSVESTISHLAFSIPSIKGIEFGAGFSAAKMKGSEHNDLIVDTNGKTGTNHVGGVVGGITNGNPLQFRVAVKPTSSIGKPQQTVNLESGKVEELVIPGRHDACIALRMPVILEAITAIVLADLMAVNKTY
ncbi:MAG TPA: chorismate synthase [Tenuifilaceae bacterium]|nr:chorismate synthase [Tenuifilaceae bacterium]